MNTKLSFDEVLERFNNEQPVHASEVKAGALSRYIWVAEWHILGCLSESTNICTSKADALDSALDMCGNVRGAKSDLSKYGRTDRVSPDAYVNHAVTTIRREKLINWL